MGSSNSIPIIKPRPRTSLIPLKPFNSSITSTDVCLPIVEQVCNSETVAYSFCTGMLMCITSAALVPIIIGA